MKSRLHYWETYEKLQSILECLYIEMDKVFIFLQHELQARANWDKVFIFLQHELQARVNWGVVIIEYYLSSQVQLQSWKSSLVQIEYNKWPDPYVPCV